MNIILKIEAISSIFIDENLNIYKTDELISLIKQGKIINLFIATRNNKKYIKSKPNMQSKDNISCKSISYKELLSMYKDYIKSLSNSKLREFENIRRKLAEEEFILLKEDPTDIYSNKTISDIRKHLIKYKSEIINAAKSQNIDCLLLGAILIDEYCRMGWDDWFDWLGLLEIKPTSMGITQVKIATARDVISAKIYNPDPEKINATSSSLQIGYYLNLPIHSINFTAAVIRLAINYQKKRTDRDFSNNYAVLAFLYSAGYTQNYKLANTKRCMQVSSEFYNLAKSILK